MVEFNYNKFYSLVYDICGHGVNIKKKNNSFYVYVQNACDIVRFCEFLIFNGFSFNYKNCEFVIIVSMDQVQRVLNLFHDGSFEFWLPTK